MKITTNNHWHKYKYWHELTIKEQATFDWMDEDTRLSASFIRYKKWVYYVGDIMMNKHFASLGWNASYTEKSFSGILLKISKDGQQYKIASYYS